MSITLKALRINAGYDQRTAAKAIGITPETLGRWENAKSFPNVPYIKILEKLYGVKYENINFLVDEEDEHSEEEQKNAGC